MFEHCQCRYKYCSPCTRLTPSDNMSTASGVGFVWAFADSIGVRVTPSDNMFELLIQSTYRLVSLNVSVRAVLPRIVSGISN